MDDKGSSVCFSGHRYVYFNMEDSAKGRILQKELTIAIKDAIKNGFHTFYTGMAQGFDIIAAEAVLRERHNHQECVKLICVVPYRGQEDKWNEKWRKRYDSVMKASDGVVLCNEEFITGCFHERNRFLVDNTSLLICLHSGKHGGTKHTFKYAKEQGLQIINIWDKLGGSDK